MSQNSRRITPLNWRALVVEALRRRRAEKLTQRRHAALASVSIPTIVAFDRGERTLSLAKAFDILRVVGLIEEPAEDGAQEIFVREAFARWNELTANLPVDSHGRFPHGWYRIDYALEGDVKTVELLRLQPMLAKAFVPHADWPMFWTPKHNDEIAPHEVDGVLECWLASGDVKFGRKLDPAEFCDFWRAAPNGRMFLIRGYREDRQETFPPGTVFDMGLAIRRLAEALLHAERLAALLKREEGGTVTVKFRAFFTGLSGRVLRAWSNPLTDLLLEGTAARSEEAMLEAVIPAAEIEKDLAALVYPLVVSLFERFGVTGLSVTRVRAEIERFRKSRDL